MTITRPVTSPTVVPNRLKNRVGNVFVVAYQEPTDALEAALSAEGFQHQLLRQSDTAESQTYAAIYRCMLNHQRAWQQAAKATQPSLIVEADFVPVVGMGNLPLPFNPMQPHVGVAWLYTCASQVYSISLGGHAEGFSSATVAYIVTPAAARHLCDLVPHITEQYGTGYSNFDSKIDGFLRQRGFKNYIPFRNYGEHGGFPSPEHRHHGISGIHRADVLYGKLAFLPSYAGAGRTRWLRLMRVRLTARLKGMGRSLLGRLVRFKVLRTCSTPKKMLTFAIRRQLTTKI